VCCTYAFSKELHRWLHILFVVPEYGDGIRLWSVEL
jgi:hypothetical protein